MQGNPLNNGPKVPFTASDRPTTLSSEASARKRDEQSRVSDSRLVTYVLRPLPPQHPIKPLATASNALGDEGLLNFFECGLFHHGSID